VSRHRAGAGDSYGQLRLATTAMVVFRQWDATVAARLARPRHRTCRASSFRDLRFLQHGPELLDRQDLLAREVYEATDETRLPADLDLDVADV